MLSMLERFTRLSLYPPYLSVRSPVSSPGSALTGHITRRLDSVHYWMVRLRSTTGNQTWSLEPSIVTLRTMSLSLLTELKVILILSLSSGNISISECMHNNIKYQGRIYKKFNRVGACDCQKRCVRAWQCTDWTVHKRKQRCYLFNNKEREIHNKRAYLSATKYCVPKINCRSKKH